MKNLETFPVTKDGKFFGYADADQIAKSNGKLELYDERKAEAVESQKKVDAAKAEAAKKAESVKTAEAAGGADASAIKKAPGK